MYARRWRFCAECHKPLFGHLPDTDDVWCVAHRLERSAAAALQLANKSGPFYDKWLETRGPKGRPRIGL